MGEYIDEYIDFLKEKKMSDNTVDAYSRDLKRFSNFLIERNENILKINVITLMAFTQELKKKGKANSSIARNIVSIRNFYKYLIRKNIIHEEPTINYEMPKIQHNIPEILTVGEVDRLLSSPDLINNKGIRDKAMLELMYAAGLKVNELLSLTIFDVNLKLSYIKCVGTKKRRGLFQLALMPSNI